MLIHYGQTSSNMCNRHHEQKNITIGKNVGFIGAMADFEGSTLSG